MLWRIRSRSCWIRSALSVWVVGSGWKLAGELRVHFEGFQFAGHADGGGAVLEDAVGLDEQVIVAESGGAGEDETGEESELAGDGEGGLLASEAVASAAELLNIGTNPGIGVEAGCRAVGGFAFGGVIAGEELSFGGGVTFRDFFGKDFSAALESWLAHRTCLYIT